jgi:flavorubredoxin
MHFSVTDTVTWVGKTDWELRKFHGEEYSTHRGSTYNSYLVQDQKTALIDTVWAPFATSYVEELFQKISPETIDYVVANHAEIDHSGALPGLMRHLPGKPIFCTANGVKSLKGHYHADWNFQVVKTGDRLNLGDRELIFIEAPMLHWPDSMFCYLTGEDILFSNDAFGQHLASGEAYNDRVDPCELWAECIKYYANILTPFSPLVLKKIEQFAGLELPLKMICPSHGVLWRDNPMQIVQKYLEWANEYREDQVTIIYDTMWNSTRSMAEAIAVGIHQASPSTAVKVFNCARADKNDVITEIFKSGAILFGSPTINQGILTATAGMLEEIRGLKFRGKKAAAFGAYGWSGESVGMLSEKLREAGFDVINSGLRLPWAPDTEALQRCVDFGKAFAETVVS